MSDNLFDKNPSEYEGGLIREIIELKILIRELLRTLNRNGIDLDDEIRELLIKTEL